MFCCHPRRTSDESFRRFAWRLIGLQKIGWIDHFEFGVMINMLMLLHGRAGNREAVRSWRVCWQPATWKAVEGIPATCPSSGSLHPPRRRANCCCLTRSRHVQLVAYGATSERQRYDQRKSGDDTSDHINLTLQATWCHPHALIREK